MAIIGGYKDVYKPNDKRLFKKEEPVVEEAKNTEQDKQHSNEKSQVDEKSGK